MASHPQLHDKVVHDLLGLFLREGAGSQIPFKIDVQEGGGPGQGS